MIICICYGVTQAQVIRSDEKIRFSFGLATFTGEQINNLLQDLDRVTTENGLRLPASSFGDHLVYQLDYESNLWDRIYYLFSIRYSKESVQKESNDINNQIYQGLNYTLTMVQGSASLLYHFPVYNLNTGSLDLVTGAGLELLYADANLLYIYSQLPVKYQKIEFLRTGFISGGRIFVGLEIPFIPSTFLQLQTGYSLLPGKKLTGQVKSANLDIPVGALEPINPDVFVRNDTYNLSQLWLIFGLAYFF
jgi:hypothetical protein